MNDGSETETDGNLSVFPYPRFRPAAAQDAKISTEQQFLPVTIIEDGWFSGENLKKAGKDEAWLRTVLEEKGAGLRDTLLLTVDAGDNVHWIGKEASP